MPLVYIDMFCFVKEDFEDIAHDNSLYIQAEFSKALNNFCLLDLKKQKIFDKNGNVFFPNMSVMLRTTCTNVEKALYTLHLLGVLTIEKSNDIDKIESWFRFYQPKRTINEISAKSIFDIKLPDSEKIFIKSKKKGFTLITEKEKIINKNNELVNFIEEKCKDDELLISKFVKIKRDSLGTKESRHIVLNGKLVNSSRYFYCLRHNVPISQIKAANIIIDKLSTIVDFPKNYALDIGEFVEDGNKYIDVVEINPLSTSICYVNNSIFENSDYDFKYNNIYGFGNEFFYDFLANPGNYVLDRTFGVNYEYINENRFEI